MQKPLVSIIIPFLNAEKFIYNTILSALNQSWENTEIILVDDGSTDNTLSVVKSIRSEKIKILTQENKGASSARNLGLKYANGDFIQWLDADDILDKYKIERQLKEINYKFETNILLSSAWGTFYHRLKSAEFNPTPLWNDLKPKEWIIYNLKYGYFMANCSWLVSREITEKAGPWNESLTYDDDGEYFFRVVLSSKFVKFEKNAICYYRKGNFNSLSASIIFKESALRSFVDSKLNCIALALKYDDTEEIKYAAFICLNNLSLFLYKLDELSISKIKIAFKKFNLDTITIETSKSEKSASLKLFTKIFGRKNTDIMRQYYFVLKVKFFSFIELLSSVVKNDRV